LRRVKVDPKLRWVTREPSDMPQLRLLLFQVFYSTSTQIGQLIENLSQGMDAGTFNFAPSPTRYGHSAQSSLSTNDISMEDRLELLLGSLTRSS